MLKQIIANIDQNTVTKFKTKSRMLMNELGALIALIMLCVVMTLLSPSFLTTVNLLNILMQISVISIIAIGMTFVILMGGIDLSVGSVMAFSGLLLGLMMKNLNVSIPIAILLCMMAGTIIGFINGFLITKFKLPPFIVTLGIMSIARGASYTITGGQPVYSFDERFLKIAGNVFKIPIPVIIMFAVFILAAYILKFTRLGRYTYAIGGNETTCILSGISVNRYKIIIYSMLGFLCSVSAVILTARLDSAVPVAGDGAELDSIAAVVIGGTSMMGGEGKISGTLIGSLIMGVVSNGLNLMIVPQGMQRMVKGAIIIIAVCIDIVRKNNAKP